MGLVILSLHDVNLAARYCDQVLLLFGDGETLAAAIRATFERRGTGIPSDVPPALGDAFAKDDDKRAQWRAFLRRGRLDNAPSNLHTVTERLAAFLMPPTRAAATGRRSPTPLPLMHANILPPTK